MAIASPAVSGADAAERLRILAKSLSLAQVLCPMGSIQQLAVPAGGLGLEHADRQLLLRVETGRVRCAGLALAAGDCLLAPPGPCRLESASGARVALLRVRCELAGALDALAELRLPARVPPDPEGLIAAAWADLLATRHRLRAGDPWMRVRGRGLVLALLGELLRQGFASGGIALVEQGRPPWLRHAIDAGRRRLGDPRLRVEHLAAAARLSPSHFAHRFSELVGQPPLRWLLAERIRRACALLGEQPELGVKGVARACGFSDPCHFSRQFRRLAGCAPSAWRRLHPSTPRDPLPGSVRPP